MHPRPGRTWFAMQNALVPHLSGRPPPIGGRATGQLGGEGATAAARQPVRQNRPMVRWVCPRCDREFGGVNQAHVCAPGITVD